MKSMGLVGNCVVAPQASAVKRPKSNPLAGHESQSAVRETFEKIQKGESFSLAAAHKAFAGVKSKKR